MFDATFESGRTPLSANSPNQSQPNRPFISVPFPRGVIMTQPKLKKNRSEKISTTALSNNDRVSARRAQSEWMGADFFSTAAGGSAPHRPEFESDLLQRLHLMKGMCIAGFNV
jgi:hypothetical protein